MSVLPAIRPERQYTRLLRQVSMSFMFPRYAGILVEKTMRTAKRFVLLTLVVFVAVSTGYSTMRVVQKEISTSRVLAGHVLVQGTDEPADGVTVELCSSD
jgi:hypothetical protein